MSIRDLYLDYFKCVLMKENNQPLSLKYCQRKKNIPIDSSLEVVCEKNKKMETDARNNRLSIITLFEKVNY